MAHLPGISLTKEKALGILEKLKENGISNILALRGDMPGNTPLQNDFKYASELVSFIMENGDFNIIGACYPEGHIESQNIEMDMQNLKVKVDAGVSHLITQLFFDNRYFYDFCERCGRLGINVPIEAGVMPVLNKAQIERMVSLSGASIPKKLAGMIDKYGGDPTSMYGAGIEYASAQISDLAANGVDGIHLYTMNNPRTARLIMQEMA